MKYDVEDLIKRYPSLVSCKQDIIDAYNIILECYKNNKKVLIAGNGGSCSDAEHIAGELMKSFKKERKLPQELGEKLIDLDPERGGELFNKLQCGLPAIVLSNHQGLNTAFINDVENGGLLTYAQQLLVYGEKGDVFLGISTSGNSKNVGYASIVAKAKGLSVIGLTGANGGKLNEISDVCIKAPATEVFMVQEYHLPIYHCICLMLENYFFEK